MYCSELKLVGEGGWRLPTMAELVSTIDSAHNEGQRIAPWFQNTSPWFWSGTPSVSPGSAWYVNFYYGSRENSVVANNIGRVRCVR